jgi:hypothetical protein
MRKQFIATTLIAAASIAFGGTALAQTTENPSTGHATQPSTGLSQEAKDAKEHAKGEYKARKQIADANKALNKSECEVHADGMAEHACKKNARAIAKQEKAEAKMDYVNEKKAIREKSDEMKQTQQ